MPVGETLKRIPAAYWVARRARMLVGDLLPARSVPGIRGRVHRNDVMFASASEPAEYERTGAAAARFVADAVEAAGVQPARGLDLGCGHGRVLRHLVDVLPLAWTACDVDTSAIRFCARAYGATPVRARRPLSATFFADRPFDVVWMGSVVTHLDGSTAEDLWVTLDATAANDAVVALSVLPPPMVVHLESFGPGMGAHESTVRDALAAEGFAYVPYPHHRKGDYGVAFHDPARLVDRVAAATGRDVELLAHAQGAWEGMQDYLALRCRRR